MAKIFHAGAQTGTETDLIHIALDIGVYWDVSAVSVDFGRYIGFGPRCNTIGCAMLNFSCSFATIVKLLLARIADVGTLLAVP